MQEFMSRPFEWNSSSFPYIDVHVTLAGFVASHHAPQVLTQVLAAESKTPIGTWSHTCLTQ